MIRNKIKLVIILAIVMICALCGCGMEDNIESPPSKDYTLINPIISMNNLQNSGSVAGDSDYLYFSINDVDGFNQMNLKTGEVKQISPNKAESIAIYNNGILYTQDGKFSLFDNKDFSNRAILPGWRVLQYGYCFDDGRIYDDSLVCGEILDDETAINHVKLAQIQCDGIAMYGDYIYGNSTADIINGSVNSDKGFWKIKKDGFEKIKLLEVPIEQFVVENEYIYYIQNRKLWRIDVNGKNLGEYSGIEMPSHSGYGEPRTPLQVFQQKLYFCAEDGFYCINTDGTGLIKLDEETPSGLYIVNDSLYYDKYDGLYMMELINNQVSQIWKASYVN